ncbi:MAG: hypothetical protein GY807_02175 [Gammaproteobacteria bacterium]|nr:hypothetical protein [Gammaproteobacteria bacterium]
MLPQDLVISDGTIESLFATPQHIKIKFRDWQENRWLFECEGVEAYEDFGATGEELGELRQEVVASAKHTRFIFCSAWSGKTVLSVDAKRIKALKE